MKNIAYFFIAAIGIVVTLIFGKALLIPFIFALLLWFIVKEIRAGIDKIGFIEKYVPSWIKSLLTTVVILSILGFISKILSASINTLAKSYPKYESNVDAIIESANEMFSMDLVSLVQGHSGDIDFGSILGSLFNSLTDILSSAFMITLYALFVFLEETNFRTKLKSVFSSKEKFEQVYNILNTIEVSISKYLTLKTFVSLITGVLSYIALAIIGIDSPIFWALIIFIFNFIPTVGSLAGTLFPAVFCLLQFGEFGPALLVLSIVGVIQILVGNILEPKLMGNSMNLSPLVSILALSLWGALWGVTGMILSIPITVIMVIICSQFEATKSVAIMLSEKGEINKND